MKEYYLELGTVLFREDGEEVERVGVEIESYSDPMSEASGGFAQNVAADSLHEALEMAADVIEAEEGTK